MHQRIHFFRHGVLEWKYADYNQLTFEELTELGRKSISPGIDRKKSEEKIDRTRNLVIDLACVSSQERTHESAKLFWATNLRVLWCLDEIYFDLSQLMTEEEYIFWGWLPSVRAALWKSFFERKPWIEPPESVMERIQFFVSEISLLKEQNVTVISHWFFLQMVKCCLEKWVDFTKISYAEFLNLEIGPVGYLESFEVIV